MTERPRDVAVAEKQERAGEGLADAVGGDQRVPVTAERLKSFTDAVVAIAMTLLVLPLIDTIGDASASGDSTADWIGANLDPILLFALSFVLIANFWMSHHRLFAMVERVTDPLLWITVAWMLTIAWLPVATALTGQTRQDPLQLVVYIGTMALTCVTLGCARLYLRAHPELHRIPANAMRRGLLADVLTTGMFLVSLAVGIALPAIGYSALFLMVLVGPLHTVVARALGISVRPATRM